jgi:fumarate hydratase subunit alpha
MHVSSELVLNFVSEKLLELNTKVKSSVKALFDSYDGPFKGEILENFNIAYNKQLPLCQDTGIVEFFVWKGFSVVLDEPIERTLEKSVNEVYTKHGFRKSIVGDPLFARKNTTTNTPCIVHVFEVEKPIVDIWIMVKGGGSENLSQLYMFQPTESYEFIIQSLVEYIHQNGPNACPPIRVGIGIGGTSDKALLLSKIALFEYDAQMYMKHLIRYEEVEKRLYNEFSKLEFGVQAIGFGDSVYDVKVYAFPTHIATLPVALSVDCYLLRTTRVVINYG